MDLFVWGFKKQPSVEQPIDSSLPSEPAPGLTAVPVSLPDGYELIRLKQSDGTTVAVRRKLALWRRDSQDSLLSSPSGAASPTGTSRTVVSRAPDGTLVNVQQPARYSAPSSRAPSGLSQSSSVYSERPERDTMTSTITIVDAALADLRRSQIRRHSRRDGSATTTASGFAVSRTSGDIQIGHIQELDEDEYLSTYSEGDETPQTDTEGEFPDDVFRGDDRSSYSSYDVGSRAFAQSQRNILDVKELPPATVSPRRDTASWGYSAQLRAEERRVLRGVPARRSRKVIWTSRLTRGSSYFMAGCSIVLPAMLLAVGILTVCMNHKATSSGWSTMESVIDAATAIWPVVFAAVVAQCFKACIIYKAGQGTPIDEHARGPGKLSHPFQRLELICLLVFLIWSLSPLGSAAIERVYGSAPTTQQVSTGVWYVDQTGYNTMWSANSTSTMSAASRSQLLQVVSDRYLDSLTLGSTLPTTNGPMDSYSLAPSIMTSLAGSSSAPNRGGTVSTLHLSPRDLGSKASLDYGNGANQALSFSMTVSDLVLTCGNWSTMTRNMTNTTSADRLSYSKGQTLGLTITSGDTSHSTPRAGSLEFVSLNNISSATDAAATGKDQNETSLWEYSAIQCDYQQYFHFVPVQCHSGHGTVSNTGVCYQSAGAALILTTTELAGTDLGDFAQDFVSANVYAAGQSATPTEAYLQTGGPVDATVLATTAADEDARLNLSATVSSADFATRFGHLLNTWVSLGYCPQCTSDVLAGNTSVIPASLQPSYRQTMATAVAPGEAVYNINWVYLAVFLVFSSLLLAAGITSVVLESVASARPVAPNAMRKATWLDGGGGEDGSLELQLPRACSTVYTTQRSTSQWAKRVMQDMEAVAEDGYTGRRYSLYR